MGRKIEYVPEKYFLSLNILYITNLENVFPEKKLQWWYNKNIPDTFLYKYMKDLGIQCCNRNHNMITNDKNSNTTIVTPPTHFIT